MFDPTGPPVHAGGLFGWGGSYARPLLICSYPIKVLRTGTFERAKRHLWWMYRWCCAVSNKADVQALAK